MDAPAQTAESVTTETEAQAEQTKTVKPALKPRKKAVAAAPTESAVPSVEPEELTAVTVEGAEAPSESVEPVADTAPREERAAAEEPSAAAETEPAGDTEPASDSAQREEPAATDEPPDTPEQIEPAAPQEPPREHTIESVRAHETPIFAAMFSGWEGPAVGMISRNLHRADDDTMVFDMLMWLPNPDETAPALRFQVGGDRHSPVITVDGELHSGSVALLTTPLRHILRRRPRQLVVDLAGITAASPAALRALLDVRGAARAAHVDFWLRSPSEPVRELLQPANAQVAVRPKSSAARRSPGPIKKRAEAGEAIGLGDGEDPEAELSSPTTTRLKARAIAARSSVIRRRPPAESTVLEGVVVQGPVTRSKPWWSTHSLRESLRRVGVHQHAHGQGSPT